MNLRRREPLSAYWIIVILIPVSIVALAVVVNVFGNHNG